MTIKRATVEDSATHRMDAARESRNRLLHERNLLLAILTTHYVAHVVPAHSEPSDGEWRHVICIHMHGRQIQTRIAPDDLPLFAHLDQTPSDWDGHTHAVKIERLEELAQLLADRARARRKAKRVSRVRPERQTAAE